MKKRFLGRRSVIIAWVSSYVLILLLSVAINLFAATRFTESLRTQIFAATSTLLRQAQGNIDARMQDIQKISQFIGSNSNVKELLRDRVDNYNSADYNRLMSDLRSYQASNSFIKNIYLFPQNKDVVVGLSFVREGPYRQQLLSQYRMRDGTDISGLFNERHNRNFVALTEIPRPSKETPVVGLVQSLPVSSNGPPDATLLITVDNSSLLASLNVNDWLADNYVFVLDDANNIIMTNADFGLPQALDYDSLAVRPDRFDLTVSGEKYTVMQSTSGVNAWKYLFLLPTGVLMQDLQDMQRLFVFSTLLALGLGVVFSILLARRNYFPLKNLLAVFEQKSDMPFSREENEFQFIEHAAVAAIAQREAVSDSYQKQLNRMRSSFFARLVKSDLDTGVSTEEMLRIYNVQFISDRFAVLLVNIRSIEGDELGNTEAQKQKVARFIVGNVLEELANENHKGFAFTVDNTLALLVNFDPDLDDMGARREIVRIVRQGTDFLENVVEMEMAVTAGDSHLGLEQLPNAYLEASATLEYCIVMGLSGLRFYRDIRFGQLDENTYHYYYPLQVEVQFTNFIKSGDYEKAKKLMDEFFRVNFEQISMPQPIARCFMFNLTSTFMKTIYELDTSSGGFADSMNAIEALLRCESVTDIRREADKVLRDLCDHTRQLDTSANFIADTQAFIEENYADANLNIPMIADHLELTSSYLSKKFKNLVGVGLLDYVNQTRVGKAKKLLKHSNASIADIATHCGFVNSNTFIRVFKKYEGVTPGRYREIVGE